MFRCRSRRDASRAEVRIASQDKTFGGTFYLYRHVIYLNMTDEALDRLLDYDRRRYWLLNGWSLRFRITRIEANPHRPQGIKYSFTLHDVDGVRLLGFDNAHGVPRALAFDHRHRFRQSAQLQPYHYRGADELISDFFAAVERACAHEGVAFEFEAEDVELEMDDTETENDDDTPTAE